MLIKIQKFKELVSDNSEVFMTSPSIFCLENFRIFKIDGVMLFDEAIASFMKILGKSNINFLSYINEENLLSHYLAIHY